MTPGQFLTYCARVAGSISKTDFARKMGYLDADHTIGAMNDKPGKEPSLEMLRRASRAAGFTFEDCLQKPKKLNKPLSAEHTQLHAQLQALLDRDDEASDWIAASITVCHTAYCKRR